MVMDQPKPINDLFKDVPKPRIGVLLGKGPSLDDYTGEVGDAFVMGINEVPLAVPCHAAFYVDPLFARLGYPPGPLIIRPRTCKTAQNGRGYKFGTVHLGKRRPVDGCCPYGAIPAIGPGVGPFALTIFGMWGVHRVCLWGFEQDWNDLANIEYAECVKPHLLFKADRHIGPSYPASRDAMLRVAEAFGIELTFGSGQMREVLDSDWPIRQREVVRSG